MNDLWPALLAFVVIIAGMMVLRWKIGANFEVRNSDILLAIVPVALWLVLTGKIQKLEFGEFKIEAAFVEASKESISNQVTELSLPLETLRLDPKEGVEQLPRLLEKKTEGLYFQLGYGGYYGPAIQEYLDVLTRSPYLKYLVFIDQQKKFAALADARQLYAILTAPNRPFDAGKFADWVRRSDLASLAGLPGFVGVENAIRRDANKQTVLEKMEKLDRDILPVMGEDGSFAGIVDRSRLTASLIIDVANKVK